MDKDALGHALIIICITIFMMGIITISDVNRQCEQLHEKLDKIELLLEERIKPK